MSKKPGLTQFQMRLPADLNSKIKSIAGKLGQSQNQLIVGVLQSWAASGAPAHTANPQALMRNVDNLVAIMSFADHALSRSEFAWAIREYRRLEIAADTHEASAIGQYARYRQAFCNWALASELRKQAHSQSSPINVVRALNAAEQLTIRSIAINREFLDREGHALLQFNLACIQAFYAALLVEKSLLGSPATAQRIKTCINSSQLWDG